MTLTYKTYRTLPDVPVPILKKLKKLSLGMKGIMEYLIDEYLDYQQGQPLHYSAEGAPATPFDKIPTNKRFIAIAFNNRTPVGWCVRDNRNCFAVFVKPNWRGQGIATQLATHYLSMTRKRLVKVYGDEAQKIVRKARERGKFKKRIRLQWY